MSDPKTWVVLRVWCNQQWHREDRISEPEALALAATWRKDMTAVTRIFVIEPSGFIHEFSKGML